MTASVPEDALEGITEVVATAIMECAARLVRTGMDPHEAHRRSGDVGRYLAARLLDTAGYAAVGGIAGGLLGGVGE